MGTTARYALPYPEPTDPVAQGAAAIRALAEKTDLQIPGVRARASSGGSGASHLGTTHLMGAGAFTTVAGRLYKITISWGHTVQSGSGQSEVQIWRNASGVQLATTLRHQAAGMAPGGTLVVTDAPGAGSINYHFSQFTSSTGGQQVFAYMLIVVEDIGPSGGAVEDPELLDEVDQ